MGRRDRPDAPGRGVSTWADVHAGYVVLGHDGYEWGVLAVDREHDLSVTLTRYGRRITGHPDPSASVVITQTVDLAEQRDACQALINAGFPVHILSEQWESA